MARGKLEWKFRDNPSGPGMIAIARADEEVLGINGFMAATFKTGAKAALGYQSMDTVVSPKARRQGVFGNLIQCFYERTDGALIYGFPNIKSSVGLFGKQGWTSFGPVPMLVRPLRAGYFLKRIARFLPDFPIRIPRVRPIDAKIVERVDESVTDIWRRFSAGIGCAVERDAAFLNWRLADHPSETYTIRQAGDRGLVASTVVAKHGATLGYLMDAIGDNEVLAPLIVQSLHEMRAAGADLAFAWCFPWSPNYAALRRAGFYPFPAKLRPILINFGARPLASDEPGVVSARQWYVSYLDSDTV